MPRYAITIICFILVLSIGLFWLWPKWQDLKELEQEILRKEQELQYQEIYLSQLQDASQQLEENKDVLIKIDSALPLAPDLPGVFNYLQKTSAQNGLILKSVSPPSIMSLSALPVKEIKLVLAMSGSYSSLKSFLVALGKTARLIEVESVSFETPQKGEIFNFGVGVKMYSY